MANKIAGLTLTIDADTTALTTALSGVNKNSKNLQSELKEVEKLLKLDPSNTELLSQKQKILAESVGNTKEKLDKLKLAAEQAQDKLASGEVSEEQFRALQREIQKTEQQLKGLTDESKNFKSEASVSFASAQAKLEEFGNKVGDVGKKMSVGITAPVAAIGTASVAAFKEIDTALDIVATKTGATGEAAESLEKSFENVYKNMPVDASAAGEAIGEVNTQFALTGEALDQASEQMLKFSRINGQDVTSSTTSSKAAMDAFELSAEDLNSTLDAVTKTAQNTGVGTDKIFDSVTRGAPQLKDLGLNFAQSAEVMGRLEQSGIDSTKALSYLSKAQVTFAKDGETLSGGLEGLISKIQNSSSQTEALTTASEYFGTKGASFMLDAIQRGAFGFEDFAGAAEGAAGSVSDTFEQVLSPTDEFTTALNNLKSVGKELAEAFLPILEAITPLISQFSQWFSSLSPQTKDMIVKIALVAAAIGPLLVVVGQIITAVGAIIAFIPTLSAGLTAVGAVITAIGGPITIIMALIGALIAYFVHLYETNEDFRKKVDDTFAKVQEIYQNAIDAITGKLKEFAGIGKNVVEGLWNGIIGAKDWFKKKIGDFFDLLPDWVKDILGIHSPSTVMRDEVGVYVPEGVAVGIEENMGVVKTAMQDMGGTMVNETDTIMNNLEDKIKSRADAIAGFAGLFDKIADDSEVTGTDLFSNLQGQVDALKQYQGDMENLVSRGVTGDLLEAIKEQGPKAAEQISALTTLTEEELNKYVELFNEKSHLAALQAQKDIAAESIAIPITVEATELTTDTTTEVLNTAATTVIDTLNTGITENLFKIADMAQLIATEILNKINNMLDDFYDMGRNITDGLWDGMKSGKSGLINNLVKMLEDTVKAAKEAMDINSPSGVMRDEVGKFMAQGVGVGFVDTMKTVRNQMANAIPSDFQGTVNYAAASNVTSEPSNSQIGEGIVNGLSAVLRANAAKGTTGGTYNINVMLPNGEVLARAIFNPLQQESKRRGESLG